MSSSPEIRWHPSGNLGAWSVSSDIGVGYGMTLKAAWLSWRAAESLQVLANSTKPKGYKVPCVAKWGGE